MNGAQVTMIAIYAAGLALTMAKHGESRGEYNLGIFLVSTTIEVAILLWGGFWK